MTPDDSTDPAVHEPVALDPAPPANPGLDYAALKREGTRLVQRLSGALWTDYNEHDPGVTTLEQLSYALTELSYRAELPLADLLTRRRSGRIEARRQALFPARTILPCRPATAADYRKLLVDRVAGVRNAWLTPLPPEQAGGLAGLYALRLYLPGLDPCCGDTRGPVERARRRARRVYAAHRSLCEDLDDVRVLQPLPVAVFGELSLTRHAQAERVLARALFELGLLLAPELRRRPLRSLLDRGLAPDEIFVGPLLRHGFIDDAQLQPKAECIGLDQVAATLTAVRGVRTLRGLRLVARGADTAGGLRVGPDEIPRLEPHGPAGGFTLRLLRRGVVYRPDAARVERELARLWADWRRPWPLAPEYRELLPFPRGQARDVRRYTSVQEQYPRVYGIGSAGLPADASEVRRGQARQLKGYLLPFEQLLADFFAQLQRARDLFSLDARLRRSYFFQSLERSVPDVAPLLRADYRSGLRRLVRSQDDFVARRNRFLDVLLALGAESLTADDLCPRPGRAQADPGRRLLRAKLELLRLLPAVGARRGSGCDVLARPTPRNVAGLVPKTRLQLGFAPLGAPLLDFVDEQGWRFVKSGGRVPASERAARIEPHFRPPQAAVVHERLHSPLRGRAVNEALLGAAARPGRLRLGRERDRRDVSLTCRVAGTWQTLGRYADEDAADRAGAALQAQAREFAQRRGQLYVVEHLLLRWACEDPHAPGCPAPPPGTFVYDFTASIVIGAPRAWLRDPGWRRCARQAARANAPAHVALDFLFLGASRLCRFERLYWAWRRALRTGTPAARQRRSVRLRDFLAHHGRHRASEA